MNAPAAAPATAATMFASSTASDSSEHHGRDHVDAEQVVLAVVAAAGGAAVVDEPCGQHPERGPVRAPDLVDRRIAQERPESAQVAAAAPAAPDSMNTRITGSGPKRRSSIVPNSADRRRA